MTTDTDKLYVLTDEERRTLLKALNAEWRRLDGSRPPYPGDQHTIERQQFLAHLMSKLRHAD